MIAAVLSAGSRLGSLGFGLLLAGLVAAGAFALRRVPGLEALSPMILAIVVGIAVGTGFGLPAAAAPGLSLASKPLLRLGIVLLGLQVTPAQILHLGAGGLAVVALTVAATFTFTVHVGRRLGVGRELAELIGAGSSICGASAVIAMNGVSAGSREDVAHAIATVTLYGTVSMLLFPLLGAALHLPPSAYGLWSGAAIHEVAQVIAAGFQGGPEAGEIATVAKLARVASLAPVVIAVGALRRRVVGGASAARPPFPWFVLGFLALVGIGGVVDVPAGVRAAAAWTTTLFFTVALGALGLSVDLRRLLGEGWRPLLLGAAAWGFVSVFSLLLVEVVAGIPS